LTSPTAPDADLDTRVSRFDQDGFALIGRLIDERTVAEMRLALERAIAEDIAQWSSNPWFKDHWMVHNLLLRDNVFLDLLSTPVLHAYLSRALSPHCTLYAYTSSSLPPHGHNASKRIHIDAQAQSIDCVTNVGVLIALDDFTDENGATLFLPRSHRSLDVPSETYFMEHSVRAYPRAGEAVLFNARTYHYGGENRTNTARHAVTLNVCRPWMKQRFDYPRMLNGEQLERLGPIGRRFVGMDSRIPSDLTQYYVAPEGRLFKPGQY
jgi:ectoine hydroxylase-related dioxygenase (phytanoyl-CoA dioxygenase family)